MMNRESKLGNICKPEEQMRQRQQLNKNVTEQEKESAKKITSTDPDKILLLKNECRHVDIALQCKNRPKTLYVDK